MTAGNRSTDTTRSARSLAHGAVRGERDRDTVGQVRLQTAHRMPTQGGRPVRQVIGLVGMGGKGKRTIGAIWGESGHIQNTQTEINNTFTEYYRMLYSDKDQPTPHGKQDFIREFQLPRLDPEQAADMAEPLQVEEIQLAITQIARSKPRHGWPTHRILCHFQCYPSPQTAGAI